MKSFKAKAVDYTILNSIKEEKHIPFPFIRDEKGDKEMFCISPLHGRSFLICQNKDGRYVISKGNGLSYTTKTFINTAELGCDSWGLLLKREAQRDFLIGNEINDLGIKTNRMEFVLELNMVLEDFNTNTIIRPVLLQYNVECPFRICDFPFVDKAIIEKETNKWEVLNKKNYKSKYLIAADVLISNLQLMHSKNILHNAIHIQNYTWALELLDFEISRTNKYPYEKDDYEKTFSILFNREMIQTYEVINYIAWCLKEEIDYKKIDDMFEEYGYKLTSSEKELTNLKRNN
jgi:hypothetical protein